MITTEWLQQQWSGGGWTSLIPPEFNGAWIPSALLPPGHGVLICSGGSRGGRRICLQPWEHLDRSAEATKRWLLDIGLHPADCLLINPLPLHHVSGLMPWWRSRCWGGVHQAVPRALMKDPSQLRQWSEALPWWRERPALVSLVPTQLARLLGHPDGVAWLQACALIWIGGAALSPVLAQQSRSLGLRLSPCYGSTETAAMVAALPPDHFLSGESSCGLPLTDTELRVASDGSLLVRTARLAQASWSEQQPDVLQKLRDAHGWWRSGDAAILETGLTVLGRLDGAIHSGGETVFPEQLETRLLHQAAETSLPQLPVLFLAEDDPEWGERLVALVGASDQAVLRAFQQLTDAWPAAERPRRWLCCPHLTPSETGKWRRDQWRRWLLCQQPS